MAYLGYLPTYLEPAPSTGGEANKPGVMLPIADADFPHSRPPDWSDRGVGERAVTWALIGAPKIAQQFLRAFPSSSFFLLFDPS